MGNGARVAAAALVAIAMLTIAPAIAATTTPFQQYLSKDCQTAAGCSVAFPVVAAATRLEIEHVSCEDQITDTSPAVVDVHLDVFESNTVKLVYSLVPNLNGVIGNTVYWVIDHPVYALVTENRRPVVIVHLDKKPATRTLRCTISGHKVVN